MCLLADQLGHDDLLTDSLHLAQPVVPERQWILRLAEEDLDLARARDAGPLDGVPDLPRLVRLGAVERLRRQVIVVIEPIDLRPPELGQQADSGVEERGEELAAPPGCVSEPLPV